MNETKVRSCLEQLRDWALEYQHSDGIQFEEDKGTVYDLTIEALKAMDE